MQRYKQLLRKTHSVAHFRPKTKKNIHYWGKMELMMKSMADMVTSMGVTHVKCSKSDSVIYKLMFCHTGSCPTDLTDLHGFVF